MCVLHGTGSSDSSIRLASLRLLLFSSSDNTVDAKKKNFVRRFKMMEPKR